MKEHPIPFTGPMVCAILEGQKTETRRLSGLARFNKQPDRWRLEDDMMAFDGGFDYVKLPKCPYGVPGDLLWVKEAWRVGAWNLGRGIAVDYRADGYAHQEYRSERVPDLAQRGRLIEQSLEDVAKAGLTKAVWQPGAGPCRWRLGMFMPRWASRITLRVEEVRVERVQDITEEGAIAEGMLFHDGGGIGHSGYRHDVNHGIVYSKARDAYSYLWDSINAKRGYSWDSNPWVWVIRFSRQEVQR